MRLAMLSLLLLASGAFAQDPLAPAPPVSPAAPELLKRIREAADGRDWKCLGGLLQKPETADLRQLVVDPERPHVSIPLPRVLGRLVRALPADATAAIREIQDPTARFWVEEWKRTRDEAHLWKVVRDHFHSSYGHGAADLLASRAFDRGDLRGALRLWRRLLESGPAGAAPVVAAKVACALRSAGRAEALRAFLERTLAAGLDGPVVEAGERTSLRALLNSLRIPDSAAGREDAAFDGTAVVDHPDGPVLAAVDGPSGVRAFRLSADRDPRFLWSDPMAATWPRPRDAAVPRPQGVRPDELVGDAGVLVGVSLAWSALTCAVDAASGRIAWDVDRAWTGVEQALDIDEGTAWPSRPLARDGRLLVPGLVDHVGRSNEAFVASLDLRSGRTVWATRIPLPQRAWFLPGLSAHGGRLYLGGQGGGIACLDEDTGDVEWIASTGDAPKRLLGALNSPDARPVAPAVWKNQVVVPSSEGPELIAVACESGDRRPSPGAAPCRRPWLHGLAVVGGHLLGAKAGEWYRIDPALSPLVRGDSFRWIAARRGIAYGQLREFLVRLDPETGEAVKVRVPFDLDLRVVATWRGRLLLAKGEYGRMHFLCPDASELAGLLRKAPEDSGERRRLLGDLQFLWRTEGERVLEPLEWAAAAALETVGESDVARLFEIAGRYPMTASAGRASIRLLGRVRDRPGLARLGDRIRETAEALPAELRRQLRDAIEAILPDVDDAEAEKWERISDWIAELSH